ncbi:DUF1616 domain-containing protein [Haloarcula nitratireducens]|uniref:DUF1616 domain-containing protein n=1 Tax=Haloarcula nitratireducens TaxID=2487749 RepID=A0AAW4P8G7_9EURY|nr:DUF1616 domain-containing protein [Halomicroarcula nitratireducens]MBX0294041.1 DUF1616 domain-containing protein [Halomicroarcula nitratireducens]
MSVTETARRLVESTLDVVPVDLVVLVAYVAFATAAVAGDVGGDVGLFVVGSILVFFAPGYAVVAALFPGRARNRDAGDQSTGLSLSSAHDGLLPQERLALAFGVSVTLIPLFAVALGAAGVLLTTESVLAAVWAIVGAGVVVGGARRLLLPSRERFDPLTVARQPRNQGVFAGDAVTNVLTVCLCLAVVAALGSATVALAGPQQSMSYTSASLLTKSGDGGLGGYPTNVTQGQPQQLVVEVTNHHQTAANYTVVSKIQRVDGGTVLASNDLLTQSRRVGVNETWTYDHTVSPSMAGQDLRLVYYVVRGPMPDDVNENTAERVLYLRLDVTPTDQSQPAQSANATQTPTPSQ